MIARLSCVVLTLLIVGCASTPTESEVVEPSSPFNKPFGSSTNYRVGFVGRASTPDGFVTVELVREIYEYNLKENEMIVARDKDLKPMGLLSVQSIKGRACLAKLKKGRILPNQEVILPNSKTREEAESLPVFTSGS